MAKYIDAEGVMRACFDSFVKTNNQAYKEIALLVEAVPAADVQEVRHGHWETIDKGHFFYDWKCSKCGGSGRAAKLCQRASISELQFHLQYDIPCREGDFLHRKADQ